MLLSVDLRIYVSALLSNIQNRLQLLFLEKIQHAKNILFVSGMLSLYFTCHMLASIHMNFVPNSRKTWSRVFAYQSEMPISDLFISFFIAFQSFECQFWLLHLELQWQCQGLKIFGSTIFSPSRSKHLDFYYFLVRKGCH